MMEFKIVPIRNGAVLDHIEAGKSLEILKALGLPVAGSSKVVSLSMNLPSSRGGLKDVLKFEDMDLDEGDLEKVQALSSTGSYVTIRNFEVASKARWGLD